MMRRIACYNDECLNAYAPFFDFEPAEVIVPCPVCGTAMTVTTLEDAAAKAAEKNERLEAEAVKAAEAELAANPPEPPTPDPVVEKLTAMGDRPVTASDLLAILRPDTMNTDAPPSPTDHPATGA